MRTRPSRLFQLSFPSCLGLCYTKPCSGSETLRFILLLQSNSRDFLGNRRIERRPLAGSWPGEVLAPPGSRKNPLPHPLGDPRKVPGSLRKLGACPPMRKQSGKKNGKKEPPPTHVESPHMVILVMPPAVKVVGTTPWIQHTWVKEAVP